MGKFFKFFLKHKKLTAVLGVGLVLLLVFAFFSSFKGQLMMALCRPHFYLPRLRWVGSYG